MDVEVVAPVLKGVPLKVGDEEFTYSSHRPLEKSRQQVMATAFPDLGKPECKAYAVVGTKGGEVKEFTVVLKGDSTSESAAGSELVTGCCQITYEDLTPSQCVEYCFAEAPDAWAMTQLSLDALETYRGMKFEAWKSMLVNPTCEAQFRRMLQIGMISKLFDPQVFPTPESMRAKYQVTDERTGKLIELPHPVAALRVWDPAALRYQEIEPRLTGAPEESEVVQWWRDFLEELNAKHGAEYIAGLIAGK